MVYPWGEIVLKHAGLADHDLESSDHTVDDGNCTGICISNPFSRSEHRGIKSLVEL